MYKNIFVLMCVMMKCIYVDHVINIPILITHHTFTYTTHSLIKTHQKSHIINKCSQKTSMCVLTCECVVLFKFYVCVNLHKHHQHTQYIDVLMSVLLTQTNQHTNTHSYFRMCVVIKCSVCECIDESVNINT